MSERTAENEVDIQRVQRSVSDALNETAAAVSRAVEMTGHGAPEVRLPGVQGELMDAYRETANALETVELQMDSLGDSVVKTTPRQIKKEHATRIKEQYDGPVLNLALMLLEHNRRKWLWRQRDTLGAKRVRRHGLTENQRSWLNDLADAWREYDGE